MSKENWFLEGLRWVVTVEVEVQADTFDEAMSMIPNATDANLVVESLVKARKAQKVRNRS